MVENNSVSLNRDEVISFTSEEFIDAFELPRTIRTKDFVQTIADWATSNTDQYDLLVEAIDCEILSLSGGGWRKGKIRLAVEFIPGDAKRSNKSSEMNFPLDIVRQELD